MNAPLICDVKCQDAIDMSLEYMQLYKIMQYVYFYKGFHLCRENCHILMHQLPNGRVSNITWFLWLIIKIFIGSVVIFLFACRCLLRFFHHPCVVVIIIRRMAFIWYSRPTERLMIQLLSIVVWNMSICLELLQPFAINTIMKAFLCNWQWQIKL